MQLLKKKTLFLNKTFVMKVDLEKSVAPNIFLLKLCGVWPISEKNASKIYQTILFISGICFTTTQIIYVFKNMRSLEEIATTCYVTLSCCAVSIKIIIFIINLDQIKNAIEDFQLKEFQAHNETQKQILVDGVKISKTIFPIVYICTITCVIMFCLASLSANEKSLPFEAWFPYDSTCGFGFVVTFLWQGLVAMYYGFSTFGIDLFFAIFILQICSQCDILCDRIVHLGQNGAENLKTDFRYYIFHHQLILS